MRRSNDSWRSWAAQSGGARAACLALLLAGVLLVASSGCTIQEITLYKTVNTPLIKVTPSTKIGPS